MATKTAKPPAEKAAPEKWQRQLGVGNPEHAAAVVTGAWDIHEGCTFKEYEAALAKYREGPA